MSAVMKLSLLAALVFDVAAKLQAVTNHHFSKQLAKHQVAQVEKKAVAAAPHGVFYGDTRCPCIGFDNIDGETTVKLEHEGEEVEVAYAADLGARCEAWDDNIHPLCKPGEEPGSGKSWCGQMWCFVDPCTCDIDVLPKISQYVPEATYRGKPIFWSYATCGGKDMFSTKVPELGRPTCRCIGFAGIPGTTEVSFANGKTVEYPGEIGGRCQAWDRNVHPDCVGDKPPSWCKANWCYVDPCDCELPGDTVPKISAYLPEATFTGKNLYYSYETCGSPDTWTATGNPEACVNQKTEKQCGENPRCGWNGQRCLGAELLSHPLCVDEEKSKSKSKTKDKSFASVTSLGLPALLVALASVSAAL